MIKILIVEDEKPISDLMVMNLTMAGYNCTALYNGREAADLLEENQNFDLILLDIMLPEINGYELMEYIQPMGIPVIFITAMASLDNRIKGLTSGAEDYIVKPFEHERLKEIISRAADKAREKIRIDKLLTERKNRKINTRTISAKIGSVNMQIPLKDIMYAEVFDRRIVLHMRSGEVIEYYGKISELEKLAGSDFFRIHRAYLINLAYIRSYDHKEVNISDSQIPIARGKHQELVKALLAYHGRERDF